LEKEEWGRMMTNKTESHGDDENARRKMGERLREARKYLGLKQSEVAEYLKIQRSALSEIEAGNRRVEAFELKRLAELYRQPVAHFMGEDETTSSLPLDVTHLARQAAKLSKTDRDELGRFADFLRTRSSKDRE